MRVTLNHQSYDIDPRDVENGLASAAPETRRELGADILGSWWPPKQAVVAGIHARQPARAKADQISNRSMNSTWASGVLRRLGFAIHDLKSDGPFPRPASSSGLGSPRPEVGGGRSEAEAAGRRTLALTLAVQVAKTSSGVEDEYIIERARVFESFLAEG